MAKAKVLLSFLHYPDGKLEALVGFVLTSMTGNSDFKNPVPALADVQAALNNFSAAVIGAQSRDKAKVALRKDARNALLLLMRSVSDYVTYTANGSRSVIVGSGLPVSAESRSTKALGKINNFTVTMGENSGDVIFSVDTVVNATGGYFFFYAIAPVVNEAFAHIFSSSPVATLTGKLTGGQKYSFKAGAFGTKDKAVYSDTITKTVS